MLGSALEACILLVVTKTLSKTSSRSQFVVNDTCNNLVPNYIINMMSRENKFFGFLQWFLLALKKGHPVFGSWMT